MTARRDKVRVYLERRGIQIAGMSDRGVDVRAVEMAIAAIGKRARVASESRDMATLETIAAGLVALDAEDAQ